MKFTKMQGAGNDFIVVDNYRGETAPEQYTELAARLCRRRISIGADGMMFVERPRDGGDFRMRYFNSDGTEGEMCGNGARCIARFGYELGLGGDEMHIETVSGTVTAWRIGREEYRVKLNDPTVWNPNAKATAEGREWACGYTELGKNGIPHAVLLHAVPPRGEEAPLFGLGRALRCAPEFPKGANVTFCEKAGGNMFRVLTYERGVEDFTLACGTGCGSTAAFLAAWGLISGTEVRLDCPGGVLSVSLAWDGARAKDIYLTGPATVVARGETP